MPKMDLKNRLRRLKAKLCDAFCLPSPSPPQPNHEAASPKALELAKPSTHLPTTQTQPNNSLGQLPAELLLEIDDHLDDSGSLALGATCKNLRQLPIKGRSLDQATVRKFGQQLERDQACRLMDAETQTLRFCAPCRDLHPEHCFSPAQWNTGSPWRRVCRGRTRRYRVCAHLALGYEELRTMKIDALGMKCPGPRSGPLGENDGDGIREVCSYNLSSSDMPGMRLQRMGNDIVHRCAGQLSGVQSREKGLPVRCLQYLIAGDTTAFCPHVRLCDLDLSRRTAAMGEAFTLRRSVWRLDGERVDGRCKVKACGASFSLGWRWLTIPDRWVVRFESCRRFKLGEPNGEVWLANSEAAEEEEEEEDAGGRTGISNVGYRKSFFADGCDARRRTDSATPPPSYSAAIGEAA